MHTGKEESNVRYAGYGLSTQQVRERVEAGATNAVKERTSRSLASIIRANIFTLFNGILIVAMIVVLIAGSWKDAVFGGVMIINAIVGIFSEWRAKRTLDALAIIDAAPATVWRDNKRTAIPFDDVVLGDAVELTLGDRIGVDGVVCATTGLDVDESLLTGESIPVRKTVGDSVLAGTAVVAGGGLIEATAVGEDMYAQGITQEAKKFSLTTSEIQQGINVVLRVISFLIIPMVVLLAWTQVRVAGGETSQMWSYALVLAVAGVVGMIPQGLVLLTSMNFALGSAKLARKGVLVQELPAVEVLARVDALCLDKTGTLTTGGIHFHHLNVINEAFSEAEVGSVLATMNEDSTNETARAVMAACQENRIICASPSTPVWKIAFSSARKWSAIGKNNGHTWLLGAPEILLEASTNVPPSLEPEIDKYAAEGKRVLLLAHSPLSPPFENGEVIEELPKDMTAIALLVFQEELRSDASETLEYFKEQGVRVRIISGDNPITVSALARQVGLVSEDGGPVRMCDARQLPLDTFSGEFRQVIRDHDVFGRVTPEQKRAMVHAIQHDGHCVAMTGDGVNDTLALKDADLGIAMGNGSSATKAVAQLVLVNNEFSVLPGVVAEGRRIIANMERVSSLFLAKTTYSVILAILTSIFVWQYPFLPRHFTYIGSLTIGIPAFAIALGPNKRLYRPGFLRRTLTLALPSGAILAGASLMSYRIIGIGTVEAKTAAALTLMIGALWLLQMTARPLVGWRLGVILVMAAAAVLGVLLPPIRNFFALTWPSGNQWTVILLVGIGACLLIEAAHRIGPRVGLAR
ncbi:MAG: hydrolase [Actinobacteria bacterium]|nr:MAG: hydrolase [Actinomycetota bacterium]